MENVGYASLQIIPSMKGFESKLSSGTSGPFGRAGTSGGRLFGDSAGKSITSTVSAHAKKAALIGAAVFGAVGAAAFKLTKDSIAEAREAQKVGGLTEAVIKSTGKAAGITADQVGAMANRLSLISGVDDEVIQRGENMLLTFKDIKNYVKGQYVGTFDQASQVTLDMAAAMAGGKGGDLDLKSSAILVGKALNDPVKGLSALQRVGVSFTKTQQAQIKALVEGGDSNAAMAMNLIQTSTEWSTLLKANGGDSQKTAAILTKDLTPAQKKVYDMYAEGGHTLEAQQRIVKELNSEFGGAAASQATMGEKVKVAWGNIQEQLGTALLPLLDRLEKWFLDKGVPAIEGWVDAFQKKAVPALKDFGKWITTKGVDKFKEFYDKAEPVAEKVLPAMVDAFDALKPLLKKAADFAGNLADQFIKMPKWAQTAIVGGLLVGKAGGFKLAGNLFGGKGGLAGLASKSRPLPVIVMNEGFGPTGSGRRRGTTTPGYVDDGNEDHRRRRRGKPGTGTALIAGIVGDELTGGKISEILAHPLRELAKEAAFPFTYGEGSAFKGLNQSQAFLLNRAKETGDLYHGGSITLEDRQLPGLAKYPAQVEAIDKALDHSISLAKRYQAILGQTPHDARTMVGITNYDEAIQQIRTLRAGLDALAERGLDNGVTYMHGGQGGPVINIGPVHVKDGRDLLKKGQQAALGGRPNAS